MTELTKPYWKAEGPLPGLDFNRHVVEPNTNEDFPQGAVAIYVDDDYHSVAALPLERYRDVSIETIVAEQWPTYAEVATYAPDHGTMEQRLHFARNEIEALKSRAKHAETEANTLRAERDRDHAGRTGLRQRSMTRAEATNAYFIQQYEHLLIATAHEGVPMDVPEKRGVCSICGLYLSDRVHQDEWIARKLAGHDAGTPWIGSFGAERHPAEE